MELKKTPVVTVCIITYNHKNYIKEAIESVLMQQAPFNWDIIIADDCSTDGTTDIVKEYAAKHPGKIKLILQNPNVGLNKNFIDLFTAPVSKYVAFLDGDDVWINPGRLKMQVEYLEANPDCAMVYGKYDLMDEYGNPQPFNKRPPYKSGYIFEDIISCRFLPHMASALMRNDAIQKVYPEKEGIGVDFFLMASICKSNKALYLDESFFKYRVNPGSITNVQRHGVSETFLKIMDVFKTEYPLLVKQGIKNGNQILLYHYAEKHPGLKSIILLLKNFRFSGIYFRQLGKCLINTLKNKPVKRNS